jgi:Glycogen recognition site of AMP-activated protein kinase
MTDSERHPYVEWIAREARRPVVTDRAARERIMAAVRAEPLPSRSIWERVIAPRSWTMSPVAGSLLAAGLVGVGVLAGALISNRDGRPPVGRAPLVAQGLPVSDTVVKFVFVAPTAGKVALVGDFNDWDETRSVMRAEKDGVWTITLPLSVGRHSYSYIVDGAWRVDPAAPVAGDGYGHMNSVKFVGKGSTL